MSLQPVVQARSAANGFGRRRIEKDDGPRLESKSHYGKANLSRLTSTGEISDLNIFSVFFSSFI